MADYHPLDVRYKGPSTAYRGSTKRKLDAAPIEDAWAKPMRPPKPAPNHKPKQPAPPPEATPWGAAKQKVTPPAPAPLSPTPTSRRRSPATGFLRSIGRAYGIIIVVFVLFTLFGGPAGLGALLSFGTGQMVSMP